MLFRNYGVARILCSGFHNFRFRTELVYDLIRRDGQKTLLLCGEAIIMLVGAEVRGFPSYVRNGLLNIFVNYFSPIHGPNFGHGPKQGIGHGHTSPLVFFRTKDGEDEFYNPLLSRVPTISTVEAVLRIRVHMEFSRMETISAADPTLSLSSRKPVNLAHTSGVQLSKSCLIVLSHWFPLSNKDFLKVFSDWRFPWFGEQPLTTH